MHTTSPSRMVQPSDWPAPHEDDTQVDLKLHDLRSYGPLGIIASIHAEPRVLPDRSLARNDRQALRLSTRLRSKVREILHSWAMVLNLVRDEYEMCDENTLPLACWEDERAF